MMPSAVNSAALSILSSSPPPPAHPPTPAGSATLSGLPTELVIEIYKAAGTFLTAERLSKTSHRLHDIWKIHADAILPKVVECFPQAKDLARVQEQSPPEPSCSFSQPTASSFSQQPITTADRICKNVTLVSSVLHAFKYLLIVMYKFGPDRMHFTPNERAISIRASYHALTLAAAGNTCGISLSLIESLDMDMLAFLQVKDAMRFLETCANARVVHFGRPMTNIPYASQTLSIFDREFMQLFRSLPKSSTFWPRMKPTIEEGGPKVESKRGAKIAELLHLFKEQGRVELKETLLRQHLRWLI